MTHFTKVVVIWLGILLLDGCQRHSPEHQIIVPEGDLVKIRLETVNDRSVHFFTYRHGGRNINFFVRTDGRGKLQAHFDACYSCFKYKLGYVWEGKQVVCIACRIGYNLEEVVWNYVGACAPINLDSGILGDFLVIKKNRLEKGIELF